MNEYLVLSQELSSDKQTLTAEIKLGDDQYTMKVHSNNLTLAPSFEGWLSIGLLPAMKTGATMRVDGPVSPRFLEGQSHNQRLFRSWKPGYHPVAIEGAQLQPPHHPHARRVGTFFSTGADSSYTFLKHQAEITDLIYLAGFDITRGDYSHYSNTAAAAQRVARHYGVNLVIVETNLREFIDRYAFWGMAHGAAMSGIGHMLSSHFQHIYVAASLDLERQIHWGTHPELDNNWSSETLEFIHDGVEARRIDKINRLASEPVILQNLRVCVYPPGRNLNCGRCEKCVRTMIALQAVGALDRCDTFDAPLDLRRIYRLYAQEDRLHAAFIAENLEALEKNGHDPALAGTLRRVQRIPWPIKKLLRLARQFRAGKPRRS